MNVMRSPQKVYILKRYLERPDRSRVATVASCPSFKEACELIKKYQKADKIKASQLVLYKEYFAKQYGFDVDKIDILYFIVKRKLIEGAIKIGSLIICFIWFFFFEFIFAKTSFI